MWTFSFGYAGDKLLEIIIEKDGEKLHDICRRRNEDILYISDSKVDFYALKYRDDKNTLERIEGKCYSGGVDKFQSAKYNLKNNTITCRYTDKEVILDYNKRTYFEQRRIGSKSKRSVFNNNTYQINPAVNKLIGHFTENTKCIAMEEIPNMLIFKFEDEATAKVLEDAVILASREVAIFL